MADMMAAQLVGNLVGSRVEQWADMLAVLREFHWVALMVDMMVVKKGTH